MALSSVEQSQRGVLVVPVHVARWKGQARAGPIAQNVEAIRTAAPKEHYDTILNPAPT